MRRLLRDDSGAMLVLVALLLPAMLGMAGVALDASHLYVQRRRMQGIADLAAVGGAASLPAQPGKARQTAREVAAANGFTHGTGSRSVQATTPYQDDPLLLHVELRDSVPPVFIQILGIRKSLLRVSAVARAASKPPVIFANNTSCSTLTSGRDVVPFYWAGNGADVAIPFHSNGSMVLGGNNNIFRGPITYGCLFVNVNNTVTNTVTKVAARPLPYTFDPSKWTCTFRVVNANMDLGNSAGPWWENFNSTPKRLKPGVYCADGGKIKLKISNVAGNVTLRATDNIELAAGGLQLTAFVDDVLAYSSLAGSAEAVTIEGSGGRLGGIIQGDKGLVKFTGNDNIVLNGSIVGDRIWISGQNFFMTPPPGGRARLVQ